MAIADVLWLLHDRRTELAEVEARGATSASLVREPSLEQSGLELFEEIFPP